MCDPPPPDLCAPYKAFRLSYFMVCLFSLIICGKTVQPSLIPADLGVTSTAPGIPNSAMSCGERSGLCSSCLSSGPSNWTCGFCPATGECKNSTVSSSSPNNNNNLGGWENWCQGDGIVLNGTSSDNGLVNISQIELTGLCLDTGFIEYPGAGNVLRFEVWNRTMVEIIVLLNIQALNSSSKYVLMVADDKGSGDLSMTAQQASSYSNPSPPFWSSTQVNNTQMIQITSFAAKYDIEEFIIQILPQTNSSSSIAISGNLTFSVEIDSEPVYLNLFNDYSSYFFILVATFVLVFALSITILMKVRQMERMMAANYERQMGGPRDLPMALQRPPVPLFVLHVNNPRANYQNTIDENAHSFLADELYDGIQVNYVVVFNPYQTFSTSSNARSTSINHPLSDNWPSPDPNLSNLPTSELGVKHFHPMLNHIQVGATLRRRPPSVRCENA